MLTLCSRLKPSRLDILKMYIGPLLVGNVSMVCAPRIAIAGYPMPL